MEFINPKIRCMGIEKVDRMKKLLKKRIPIFYRIGSNIKFMFDFYKYFKVLRDLHKLLSSNEGNHL